MTYRKKLIEVALPLESINAASAREKSIRHGHPSTLHLWWARRPLAACRAVIFASLVDDPDDPDAPPEFVDACKKLPRGKNAADHDTPRQRLFDFMESLVRWESTTDERVLETARELIRLATNNNPPPLLDPFAGGGSIPLEAQRLGLEAHAGDLNPVAVMINKAMIEIPPRIIDIPPVNPLGGQGTGGKATWKGTAGLAADVRYYGQWIRDRAWERIGHLYPELEGETVIAWLWARTVKCPNPACGAELPLVTSYWLSKKKGQQAWIEPRVNRNSKAIQFDVKSGKGGPPAPPKVGRGANFRCLVCGEIAPESHIKEEGIAGRMHKKLMAIITEGKDHRNFYEPDQEQLSIESKAEPSWRPLGEIADDTRALWCKLYGLEEFADLFTKRQLVSLTTFSDLIVGAREIIQDQALDAGLSPENNGSDVGGISARAYAEAVSVYLSFALDRSSDYWSTIATPAEGFIRDTFARQGIPMAWDFAEANPFSNSTGNWLGAIDWIARAIEKFVPIVQGEAVQEDATNISVGRSFIVSTDPPYYDNIGYAILSDYFYIWLRHNLKDVYPEYFSTLLVPKESELVAAPYRFDGSNEAAKHHFENGLQTAFSKIHGLVDHEYPLTVYYAFKQSEIIIDDQNAPSISSTGWETMLEGLIQAGFAINGTWPMRTERGSRTISLGTNALASSIILVCRPRAKNASPTSRREFINDLRKELPDALSEMQSGNIAPVDLAQASIGPGMAVYSRYSKILEPNGDRLTVRTALQIINHELDAYLAEQEGYIDEDSRFAVAWFEQFGFKEGPFGQADVLARAKNTSVEGLASAGVLESGGGKVRLLHWSEIEPGWDPTKDRRLTVWEATHHLIERLNTYGEEGTAQLLAKMPSDLAAEARQLAYRLYSICERKGWAEHARDYNALVVSWSASQEQAREFRDQYQQGRLFE
jgi:putative DNA methylase